MKKLTNLMLLTFVGCITAGCANMGPEKSLFGGDRVTTASANQMFEKSFEAFSDDDLKRLLDPEGTQPETLTQAFLHANEYNDARARRSQIQDRLIAASNSVAISI